MEESGGYDFDELVGPLLDGRLMRDIHVQPCVVSCDNIITIDKASLGGHIGFPFERQHHEPTVAIVNAFALRPGDLS